MLFKKWVNIMYKLIFLNIRYIFGYVIFKSCFSNIRLCYMYYSNSAIISYNRISSATMKPRNQPIKRKEDFPTLFSNFLYLDKSMSQFRSHCK